jgi:hypothetical protein
LRFENKIDFIEKIKEEIESEEEEKKPVPIIRKINIYYANKKFQVEQTIKVRLLIKLLKNIENADYFTSADKNCMIDSILMNSSSDLSLI